MRFILVLTFSLIIALSSFAMGYGVAYSNAQTTADSAPDVARMIRDAIEAGYVI